MVAVRQVSASDTADFEKWHAALAAGALDGRRAATVSSLRELTDSLANPSPVKRRLAVGAFEDSVCVGAMLLEFPLQSDLETAAVEIDVPRRHRGQGVGAALWRWAEQRAAAERRSVFQAEVYVPTEHTVETWPGARFAVSRGFLSQNVEDHLVVPLPFDPDRLATLEATQDAPDGYRVVAWSGACPDKYVAAWADLHTAMSADVPTGGLTRDPVVQTVEGIRTSEGRMARNWITLSSLSLNDRDEPVGYSTLYLPRTQPEHAYQDDTLVLRRHRGHNLGTRLKVANLRQHEQLPESDIAERRWLHTYTEQGNAPMQVVNERFGFRRVEVMHEFEKRG